jgi:hypothetical protein
MNEPTPKTESVSRRDFLRVGGMGVVSLKLAEKARALHPAHKPRNCILIQMTGGPSQLETFDPKPEAPRDVRGPLRPIQTSIPGVSISESLPKIAQRLDQMTVIRSLYHREAPIHETGMQLLNTGRLARGDVRFPAFGSVIKRIFGEGEETFALLPGTLSDTGVNTWRGEGAGFLGEEFEPAIAVDEEAGSPESHQIGLPSEPESIQARYGSHRPGKLLRQARQLLERGSRVVVVNLHSTLHGERSWDAHGQPPHSPTTIQDVVEKLCPQFDRAFSALIDDLQERGLFDQTIVLACGEFGRTPRLNPFGGRDHWTRAWSCLIAGDGIPRGQVVGATDRTASEIVDRPVHLSELTASLYHLLGVPRNTLLTLDDGNELPLIDAQPMPELTGA